MKTKVYAVYTYLKSNVLKNILLAIITLLFDVLLYPGVTVGGRQPLTRYAPTHRQRRRWMVSTPVTGTIEITFTYNSARDSSRVFFCSSLPRRSGTINTLLINGKRSLKKKPTCYTFFLYYE